MSANLTCTSWHERFGHLNPAALKKTLPLQGVSKTNEEKKNCDVCIEGKFKKKPFPIDEHRRAEPLQRIHSDVVEIKPSSHGGANYFVTFSDENSNYRSAVPIKMKSDVFKEFQAFQAKAENHHHTSIQEFQTDGGGEYCGKDFKNYVKVSGICHRKSCPESPPQNGKSERVHLTLYGMKRSYRFTLTE